MLRTTLTALVLCLSSSAWAWPSPAEAINQFLSFELSGGRLTGDKWNIYTTKYLAAPSNYEEPGWDEVTIVKSWSVSQPTCSSPRHCSVNVTFDLLPTSGINDPNVVPHAKGGTESLQFNLVKNKRGWFVAPEMFAPRVLEAEYRKFRSK